MIEFKVRKSYYCHKCNNIINGPRCEIHSMMCGYLLSRDPGGYEIVVTPHGDPDSAIHLGCEGRVTLHKIKDAIFAYCKTCGLRVRVE